MMTLIIIQILFMVFFAGCGVHSANSGKYRHAWVFVGMACAAAYTILGLI